MAIVITQTTEQQFSQPKSFLQRMGLAALCGTVVIFSFCSSSHATGNVQMLPPVTEATKLANPPITCPAGSPSLLTWDGQNPITCATGTTVAGGGITSGTVTVTTTVTAGSSCSVNGEIAQSNTTPGLILSCQSGTWQSAQSGTGSSGWVTVPSGAQGGLFNWVVSNDVSPSTWCQQKGYNAASGACRGQWASTGVQIEGPLVSNTHQNGVWSWTCQFGGSSFYMDATTEILCIK